MRFFMELAHDVSTCLPPIFATSEQHKHEQPPAWGTSIEHSEARDLDKVLQNQVALYSCWKVRITWLCNCKVKS